MQSMAIFRSQRMEVCILQMAPSTRDSKSRLGNSASGLIVPRNTGILPLAIHVIMVKENLIEVLVSSYHNYPVIVDAGSLSARN